MHQRKQQTRNRTVAGLSYCKATEPMPNNSEFVEAPPTPGASHLSRGTSNAWRFAFVKLALPGRFTPQSQHHYQRNRRLRLLFQGNIRPRSRPSERPGELRCVLTPSALHRAWVPQFFSAVKGAPERRIPCGKPHDSTSAQRHGATNRPKGHSGPSACKKPWA